MQRVHRDVRAFRAVWRFHFSRLVFCGLLSRFSQAPPQRVAQNDDNAVNTGVAAPRMVEVKSAVHLPELITMLM